MINKLSINRLVYLISFLAIFAMAAKVSVDTDTWWHLRAGQWIVENRLILTTDLFSYTRYGEPWFYPGWLVEVPMYWIYATLGPGGLNLWTAVIVTLAFGFVWQTLSGGRFLRAFVVVLAAATSAIFWAARPYLVTFLLAAVYLWILEGFRWGKGPKAGRRIWLLPLLMTLWANSHGGFAVGFLLWGVYFTWEGGRFIWSIFCNRLFARNSSPLVDCHDGEHQIFQRRFAILSFVGLLMVLAVCVNPFGPVVLAYPFKTVSIGVLREFIQEWQTPDFHSLTVQPFVWLLVLTFGAVGFSKKRMAYTDFVLVAGFTYLGMMAARNIALFALVSPMVLTRHAAPLFNALGRMLGVRAANSDPVGGKRVILNWAILSILILAVGIKVSQIYPNSVNEQVFRESLPLDAVEYIQENKPPGRMFNSYNWGGYLIWELPEYQVFVDGRTDLYSDEILNEWLQVFRAEDGWEEVLDKRNVNLILLEPDMPIVSFLENEGWENIFSDQIAVVYTR